MKRIILFLSIAVSACHSTNRHDIESKIVSVENITRTRNKEDAFQKYQKPFYVDNVQVIPRTGTNSVLDRDECIVTLLDNKMTYFQVYDDCSIVYKHKKFIE